MWWSSGLLSSSSSSSSIPTSSTTTTTTTTTNTNTGTTTANVSSSSPSALSSSSSLEKNRHHHPHPPLRMMNNNNIVGGGGGRGGVSSNHTSTSAISSSILGPYTPTSSLVTIQNSSSSLQKMDHHQQQSKMIHDADDGNDDNDDDNANHEEENHLLIPFNLLNLHPSTSSLSVLGEVFATQGFLKETTTELYRQINENHVSEENQPSGEVKYLVVSVPFGFGMENLIASGVSVLLGCGVVTLEYLLSFQVIHSFTKFILCTDWIVCGNDIEQVVSNIYQRFGKTSCSIVFVCSVFANKNKVCFDSIRSMIASIGPERTELSPILPKIANGNISLECSCSYVVAPPNEEQIDGEKNVTSAENDNDDEDEEEKALLKAAFESSETIPVNQDYSMGLSSSSSSLIELSIPDPEVKIRRFNHCDILHDYQGSSTIWSLRTLDTPDPSRPNAQYPQPRHHVAHASANAPSEDEFVVAYCDDIDAWLFTAIDGHGGPFVSGIVQKCLAKVIFQEVASTLKDFTSKSSSTEYSRTDVEVNGAKSPSNQGQKQKPSTPTKRRASESENIDQQFIDMIQQALHRAALIVDDYVTEVVKRKSLDVISQAPAEDEETLAMEEVKRKLRSRKGESTRSAFSSRRRRILRGIWNSGCCCCFSLYLKGRIWVGNLGDCRAVLIEKIPNSTFHHQSNKEKENMQVDSPPTTSETISTTSSASMNQNDEVVVKGTPSSPVTSPLKRIRRAHPVMSVGAPSKQIIISSSMSHLDVDESHIIHVTPLSRDHTCDDPEEANQVRQRSGDPGAIRWNGGKTDPLRVDGTLVPTRAFGNTFLKGYSRDGPDDSNGWPRRETYITADPEFLRPGVLISEEKNPFLILASDGLWAWMSNEEVAAFVGSGANAKDLVHNALEIAGRHAGCTIDDFRSMEPGKERRKFHDDITVIIVEFFP